MRKLVLVIIAASVAACGGGGDPEGGGLPGGSVAEVEPNDTPGQATPISLNSTVRGALSSSTDVDYFTFNVPAGGQTVRFQTFDSGGTGCATIDTRIIVSTPTTYPLATNDNGGVGYCSDMTLKLLEGIHRVEVDGFSTTFAYVLTVSAVAAAAVTESEPNDDGSVATSTIDFSAAAADGPFTSPTIVTGSIGPSGDDDYFAVRNPYSFPAVVHLETFQTWNGVVGTCPDDINYNTDIDVYDASGNWLAGNNDGGLFLCSMLDYELAAGATVYVGVTRSGDSGTIPTYKLLIDI